jgi:hypothetical protein
LQHLLRLPIFSKTRLVAFHLKGNKETTITGFCKIEKMRELMTLIHCALLAMTIVTKRSPQTDDAEHRHLMLLSESTSLSHYPFLEKA